MKRIAIVDLGTNTFNLIIAEIKSDNSYTIVHSEKRAVKLGEGGINKGEITPLAFERGISAIDSYYSIIKKYSVSNIKAFGTSALRSASNGTIFLDTIKNKTGISVEIVSGDREADLIYLGVRQTLAFKDQKFLILDIGGGSNEFILADMKQVYWKKSYPLGIARLLEKFPPSDPLKTAEIKEITTYLEHELQDLLELLKNNKIDTLVGASGSFETFVHMLSNSDVIETEGETEPIANKIRVEQFEVLHEKLITSTHDERTRMKGLEEMRIEMIVLASLFVKTLFNKHSFEKLYQSNYSMKEGAIIEIIHQNGQ